MPALASLQPSSSHSPASELIDDWLYFRSSVNLSLRLLVAEAAWLRWKLQLQKLLKMTTKAVQIYSMNVLFGWLWGSRSSPQTRVHFLSRRNSTTACGDRKCLLLPSPCQPLCCTSVYMTSLHLCWIHTSVFPSVYLEFVCLLDCCCFAFVKISAGGGKQTWVTFWWFSLNYHSIDQYELTNKFNFHLDFSQVHFKASRLEANNNKIKISF